MSDWSQRIPFRSRELLALVRADYQSKVTQFIGAFGWSKFSLPAFWTLEYLLFVVIVGATELSTKQLRLWERGVLLLVFLGGIVVVHAALFVSDGTLCAGDPNRLCFDLLCGYTGEVFSADLPFRPCGAATEGRKRAFGPPTRDGDVGREFARNGLSRLGAFCFLYVSGRFQRGIVAP